MEKCPGDLNPTQRTICSATEEIWVRGIFFPTKEHINGLSSANSKSGKHYCITVWEFHSIPLLPFQTPHLKSPKLAAPPSEMLKTLPKSCHVILFVIFSLPWDHPEVVLFIKPWLLIINSSWFDWLHQQTGLISGYRNLSHKLSVTCTEQVFLRNIYNSNSLNKKKEATNLKRMGTDIWELWREEKKGRNTWLNYKLRKELYHCILLVIMHLFYHM